MDSLLANIDQKRTEAKARIKELRNSIISLEHDIIFLDKTEAAIRGESLTVVQSVIRREKPENPQATYKTIKQMVMIVLEDFSDGATALEILSEINSRFKQNYLRTSLSPQLSRLRQSGDITKNSKRWLKSTVGQQNGES